MKMNGIQLPEGSSFRPFDPVFTPDGLNSIYPDIANSASKTVGCRMNYAAPFT